MFLAAYRWGVLPADYMDRTPEWVHLATLAWLGLHRFTDVEYLAADPYRFEVGEHVDQERWDRWVGKAAGAKYAMMARDATAPAPDGPRAAPAVETFRDDEGNLWQWEPPRRQLTEQERRQREAAVRARFLAAGATFEDPAMDPRNARPEDDA